MNALCIFFIGLAVTAAMLVVVWLIQLRTRNAGLVDAVWSASLGVMALLYAAAGDAPGGVRILLALLAGLWSLRLASYLGLRMRGKPEDSRYAAARASWGSRADFYMLLFFLFQAVIAWILSLPFLVIAYMPTTPGTGWLIAAVAVWLVSVLGEAQADAQLQRFRADPANHGQVCRRGWWRYSRHPNYFFESTHWLAYVLLASASPWWWATLASPVIMAVLLLKVSGIPTLENREAKNRRAGYDDYIRTTSAFVPWPPKKN